MVLCLVQIDGLSRCSGVFAMDILTELIPRHTIKRVLYAGHGLYRNLFAVVVDLKLGHAERQLVLQGRPTRILDRQGDRHILAGSHNAVAVCVHRIQHQRKRFPFRHYRRIRRHRCQVGQHGCGADRRHYTFFHTVTHTFCFDLGLTFSGFCFLMIGSRHHFHSASSIIKTNKYIIGGLFRLDKLRQTVRRKTFSAAAPLF